MNRPRISFGHRARMTAVTSGASGLVLLILFLSAIYGFYLTEYSGVQDVLGPAVTQAKIEANQNILRPDLDEIVKSNAELSISVYDAHNGYLLSRRGNLIVPLFDKGGSGFIGTIPVVVSVFHAPKFDIVAAMPWRPRERAIQRFTWLLVGLWLPVVMLIAVITWSSSRSTFEPLERLASQAEALSVQNLSSRLEIESGEYAEFARRLNRFLDRLEMSVRREERFVSDAAHELRTPLTVMRGRLETNLLRDRTEAEYKDTLQGVLVETERLSGLVEMLLQSATLVDKAVMPLDLQEQVEKTHARWVDRFDEHNIELQLESDPCSARIRAREFEVVADNLLSNALKASPFNTTVRLRLEHDHAVCRLHVSDEGPGVPPEARAAIFERFARLDPGRNRDSGGFGIGLAVCKRIVDERGGTIFLVDSERGAHFVVEFPSECE